MIFPTILCVLMAGVFSCVHSQATEYEPVCNPANFTSGTSPTKPLPVLPTQFSTLIEANIGQWNVSMVAEELFDEQGNRGKLTLVSNDSTTMLIFDYDDAEVFFISDGVCVVYPISGPSDFLNDTFGFQFVNGSVHIGTVGNLFDIGKDQPMMYCGIDQIRGIQVDHWQTCTVEKNNSYTLDYYFTTDHWMYAYNSTPTPIQITLNGRLQDENGTIQNVNHVYSFVLFNSGPRSVPDEEFQVPFDLPCSGRIPGMVAPTLPDYFSFYVDSTDSDAMTSGLYKEYYDFNRKLYRIDFYYDGEFSGNPGAYSLVHDFNIEVGYLVDSYYSNCSTFSLINNSLFDAIVGPGGLPELKSPKTLFFLTNTLNYSYEGVTHHRGVDVDAWISFTDNVELNMAANLSNATIEWFFTRPGWNITSDNSINTKPIPWRLEMSGVRSYFNDTIVIMENVSAAYHFYDFSTHEPSVDIFDTSSTCPSEYHVLTMIVPGKVEGVVNLTQFRRNIRMAIANYSGIYPLQVGSIQVIAENGTHIFMTLRLSSLSKFAQAKNPKTADEILQMILNNTASDGRLPFMVEVGPDMLVYPYLFRPTCNTTTNPVPPSTPFPTTPTTTAGATTASATTASATTAGATTAGATTAGATTASATTAGATTAGATTAGATTASANPSLSTVPTMTSAPPPDRQSSCDKTYSTSQAAGLAVGMLVLGVILGVVCTIMVLCMVRCYRNKCGKVVPVKYEMVST